MVDGVFEAFADAESNAQSLNPQSIKLNPARIDDAAINQMRVQVHTNARACCAPWWHVAHLESHDDKDMAAYAHSGVFAVNAGARIEAADRARRERMLRYCARPALWLLRMSACRHTSRRSL